MEDLHDYTTGGVVHIVANNNIGFTTTPRQARSAPFPTEIGKTMNVPIIHVNGDYPEEVDFVGRIAADWRKEFGRSVFLDLIGYRKHGHNELDEPLFTNPLMYQLIKQQKPTLEIYKERLISQNVLTEAEANEIIN